MAKRVVTSVLERFATIVLAEGYRGRRGFEIKVGKFTGVCVRAHVCVHAFVGQCITRTKVWAQESIGWYLRLGATRG